MSYLLTALRTQADHLISADSTELALLARERLVKSGIEEFSHDRPDRMADDVTGDAGRYYILSGGTSVLGDWSEGFSRIVSIEYPAATVASDELPTYLDAEDWRDDYWASDVRYLLLPNHAPAATEKMRITYTTPWAWSVSTSTTAVAQTAHGFTADDYVYLSGSTWYEASDVRLATHQVSAVADANNFTVKELQVNIKAEDFFTVTYLIAALYCQAVADRYARIGDSTVGADAAAHVTKSTEFSRRAAELRKLYYQRLGMDQDIKVKAAAQFVDWDTAPGWPTGRQYIFHGNR